MDTERRRVVSLQGSDPMRTLYSRVLAPLADAFRDLRSWLAASQEVKGAAARHQAVEQAAGFLKIAADKEARLGEKIASIERKMAEPDGANSICGYRDLSSAGLSTSKCTPQRASVWRVSSV